jgi:hypothetical protein
MLWGNIGWHEEIVAVTLVGKASVRIRSRSTEPRSNMWAIMQKIFAHDDPCLLYETLFRRATPVSIVKKIVTGQS